MGHCNHLDSNLGEPASDLKFPRQFVLWAIRQWCFSCESHDGERLVRTGFANLGIEDGYGALDTLLGCLVARPGGLQILAPNRRDVSADERHVLDALSLMQRGSHDLSALPWAHWMTPATLRLALQQALALTTWLTQAGLMLSLPAEGQRGSPGMRLPNITLH